MRLPRRGILIRLCIYIPLLAYFGWAAWQKHKSERAADEVAPAFEGKRQVMPLGDGRSIEVIEISEDQARQMGIEPQRDAPPAEPVKPPAGPPAPVDATAPATPPAAPAPAMN